MDSQTSAYRLFDVGSAVGTAFSISANH
jgi:hypothetical protein